jgi:hypothetical protein
MNQDSVFRLLIADFLLRLLFYPEDEGDMFLRNIGGLLPNYNGFQVRRPYSTFASFSSSAVDAVITERSNLLISSPLR